MTSEDRNNITPPTPPVDTTELYFTCPQCGGTNLYLRQEALLEVQSIYSDGEIEFDEASPDKDLGYECRGCEFVLRDEDDDPVCNGETLAAWLIRNCDQSN